MRSPEVVESICDSAGQTQGVPLVVVARRCHLVPCTSSRLLACVFDHRVLSVIWCVIGMDEIASDRRIDLRLCGSDARCASRCCRQEMSSRAVYELTVARLHI
jgi:hypothetical protein